MSEPAVVVDADGLRAFCIAALEAGGVPAEQAALTADVLVRTELRGVWTHGVQTLDNHLRNVAEGGVVAAAEPEIVREAPTTALLDGRGGFGFVCSLRATELVLDKARRHGVATVLVRNSNHFGAAGHYALTLAEAGLIGLATGNASPIMAITGARAKAISNAPFAYGVPRRSFPLVLDIAMSASAAMKIRLAAEQGETLPEGLIVDAQGRPSVNPADYLDGGAMVPMGGHKGYGLAVFTEVLAAALSGAAMTTSVLPWLLVHDRPTDVGHAFIAIDPERFMARREFEVRVDELVERLQGTDRAPGVERIYVPGELEHEREATALVHGLPLRPVVWQHLRDAARRVGLTGELSRLRAGAPA